MRPLAGVDEKSPKFRKDIQDYLGKRMSSIDNAHSWTTWKEGYCVQEIVPCDELPLMGPMFGDSRILLAAGYMGTGLTLGFQAGKCLAQLISSGSAPSLPRRLWPERLRSL